MPKLFVPTPHVIEVTWEVIAYETINTCNVAHFLNLNPPTTQDQVNAIIGQLAGWFSDTITPFLSEDMRFDTATCRPQDSFPPVLTIDHAHITIGGTSGAALPNNCAFRLELDTFIPGRAYHGRKYVVGLPRSVVVGNMIDEGWAIGMRAAWASLVPIAVGFGWSWVLLSKVVGGVPRSVGLVTDVLDVSYRNLVIDSQRHRLVHV